MFECAQCPGLRVLGKSSLESQPSPQRALRRQPGALRARTPEACDTGLASEYLGSIHTLIPHQETGPAPQYSGRETFHLRSGRTSQEAFATLCLWTLPSPAHLLPTQLL